MNIQFASDLHLEFICHSEPDYIGIEPSPTADVLVLAGDIHNGISGVELFKDWPVPVIYVYGNHEAWDCDDIDERLGEMRRATVGTSVHFLERDAVVIDGVRFLGTTLWTNYLLNGVEERQFIMDYCARSMNDHSAIRSGGYPISPSQLLVRHNDSVGWLTEKLASPFDGKTVVVTHHAPHDASLIKWQKSEYLKSAYASDLTWLMDVPALWLHGHVHTSVDYCVRNTRIAANPRGYPRVRWKGDSGGTSTFQNKLFGRQKTIDVD